MPERDLLRAVTTGILDGSGLLWHHCPRPWLCWGTPGLPDLIVVGHSGLMVPELKSERGRSSLDQQEWGRRLTGIDSRCSCECERAGELWNLYRPADLEAGKIERDLNWLR